MSIGRVLSTVTATAVVAGCAIIVIGVARAQPAPNAAAEHRSPVAATHSARPATRQGPETVPIAAAPSVRAVASSSAAPAPNPVTVHPTSAPVAAVPPTTAPGTAPATTTSHPALTTNAAQRPAHVARRVVTSRPATHAPAARRPATHHPAAAPKPAPVRGSRLPLHYKTYYSTRVLTVRSYSPGSTTAVFQAWSKAPGGGWLRHGDHVVAHVGADGIGQASEYTSKTPAGAFTLTQAFGHYSNPGTTLPYTHTNSSDWWISQAGSLYNTHQRCSSGCGFNRGSPNEHLYYETPYYNYATVIDYNTRNAPGGVHAGKGSAFFLHVTDGAPTAGCVAISQDKLVSVMRWLTPSSHPRILIGVT